MRVEIEVYEAQGDDGSTRRVRIVREWRDPELSEEFAILARDHDSGDLLDLRPDGRVADGRGMTYVLQKQLV